MLGALAGVTGLLMGVLSSRLYSSSATFIPQGTEPATSGLALAASQFGIRIPGSGNVWGPPMYVELLKSHAVLAPIVLDTLVVPEDGGRRVQLAELLEVHESTPALQEEYGVRAMHKIVSVGEIKPLNAVKFSVITKWPSVSFGVAQRLVEGINDFNLRTRKSQAMAERQFVELRAREAEDSLRAAENRLLGFLQRNRAIVAPELQFEHERLQRELTLRTQVYTSLLQSREEAKMREVRDTPVITLIEAPRLAALGLSRRTVQKAFLGGIAGLVIGVLFAFTAEGVSALRQRPTTESQEFFRLVAEATPGFFRRTSR